MTHMPSAALQSSSTVALLVLAALIYLRGWIGGRRRGQQTIAGWRAASFFVGLFSIGLALASPIAALDHELLTAHMAQHLLLMTMAPAFILLGAPLLVLSHGSSHPRVRSLEGHGLRPVPSGPGQLAFCWVVATATLVGWHIPSLFTAGLQSESWHVLEHLSFIGAGFLFWWPVIQPWPNAGAWPRWPTILYLFLATIPCDILSAFLVFCDRVVYTVYVSNPQQLANSALEDQQRAGALMWTSVTLVYLVAAAIVAVGLLSMRSVEENELTPPDVSVVLAGNNSENVRVG